MDNLAIARVLNEIGDLLEIKGENPFKIRAYRNAAETASHLAERLADLTPPQRLAIPGIGKDLAAKIGTLIETGSIPYHQELLQEFPASILDLLHLQGVGPKTAALLYRELGIRTLDDLEAAITQGRLQKGMPPFGRMMNDEQVAAVVNYIRTHFGNDYGDAVTAQDVKDAR